MQQILDFAPLVVFLVAYYLKDLYFATGALMLAMRLDEAAAHALAQQVDGRGHGLVAGLAHGRRARQRRLRQRFAEDLARFMIKDEENQ